MAVATYNNKRSGCYLGETASLNIVNEEIRVRTGSGILDAGTLLGQVLDGTPAVTPGTPVSTVGGTVGNGAVGAWTADAGVAEGAWKLKVTVTGATGKYEVRRPDGSLDGIGTIGSAYNGGINGTLADGANDWLVGDEIPMAVAYATDAVEYVPHDPALTNGGQNVAAILFHPIDATSADVKTVATRRGPCTINGNMLTFKSGISANDKAAAIQALRDKGMIVLPQHAA